MFNHKYLLVQVFVVIVVATSYAGATTNSSESVPVNKPQTKYYIVQKVGRARRERRE